MITTPSQAFAFNEKLNTSFLAELFEGDFQYAETVFGDFLKYLPEYSQEIKSAYQQKNLDELRKAVHKCKTLLGFVGLSDIQAHYQSMEKMCESGLINSQIDEAYDVMQVMTNEASVLISQELDRLKSFNSRQ